MKLVWPLVGRRDELRQLTDALTATPRSHGVVLAGRSGVGKTRMAQEALARERDLGALTEWAVATSSAATIPFAALAHLVPRSRSATSLELMQATVESLANRAEGRRLVIGVDDAHLLDDASATLVHHLASVGVAQLVLTVRASEVAPEAVVALWKDGMLARLEVEPLSRVDVETLVRTVLGHWVDGTSMQWLWATSGGNLLYIRELVLGGIDSGQLRLEAGVWAWHGDFAPGPRVAELVAARLGRLDPPDRAVLELLAFAEPLDVAVLARRASAQTLMSLEQRSLVTVVLTTGGHQARLAHPLYGEVLRAEVPALRAEAAYRWLAEVAEGAGIPTSSAVLLLATWRLASGGGGRPEVYLAAARHAHALLDPGLVERLARAALAAGGAPFEAGLALGEALAWKGEVAEADALLAALVPEARTNDDRARLALAHAVALFWGHAQPRDAEGVLARAEATIDDGDLRHELMAFRAAICLISGRSPDAVQAAIEVLDSPDATAINRIRTLMALLPALALCGQLDRALLEVTKMAPIVEAASSAVPEGRARLLSAVVLVHLLAGSLEEADVIARATYRETIGRRAQFTTPMAAVMLGATSVVMGRMADAIPLLREAAADFRVRDANGFLPWALANLAQALSCTGQVAEAAMMMNEADAALGPTTSMFAPDVARARAWVAAGAGELSRARFLAMEAADEAKQLGHKGVELGALHDAVRLGVNSGILERIGDVGRIVGGHLAATYVMHARALHEPRGAQLDEVARTFQEIGALLLAAEASAEAADCHARVGLQARQRASTARAAALLQACGCHLLTPALASLDGTNGLTQREREVAGLAARGMANREIADRLSVSVRTIEGHLANAFGKLGVTNRGQLQSTMEW